MATRWLVLETPAPEEIVVGAARLRYDAARNGRVDCFGVAQGSELEAAIGRMLVSKLETVCYNTGLRSCIIEAAQWRTDLEGLLTACGYEEQSGHIWPEDRQAELLKPTMVLEYHKVFPTITTSTRDTGSGSLAVKNAQTLTVEEGGADALLEALAAMQAVTVEAAEVGSGSAEGVATAVTKSSSDSLGGSSDGSAGVERAASMPQLLNTLFAALHAEYGDTV